MMANTYKLETVDVKEAAKKTASDIDRDFVGSPCPWTQEMLILYS